MDRQQVLDWLTAMNERSGKRVVEPNGIVLSVVLPLVNSGYVTPSLVPEMGVWLDPAEVQWARGFVAEIVRLGYADALTPDTVPTEALRRLLGVEEAA